MSSAPKAFKFDVFLSYSNSDSDFVNKLKDDLFCYGIKVWLDSNEIRPGDLFVKALEQGLYSSRTVVLVVSEDAMRSGWVEEEYSRAISLTKERKDEFRLIPIILEEVELPGFLKSRQYVNFLDDTKYYENVKHLVFGITGTMQSKSYPCLNPTEHDLLWRLAYTFLRLEQLPSGGWARSLPMWFQIFTGGTEKGRSQGFQLREDGGMNLSCLALLNYTRSIWSVIGNGKCEKELLNDKSSDEFKYLFQELNLIEKRNRVAHRAVNHIVKRINMEGAIPDNRNHNPENYLHHTVLGIIVLLLAHFLSAENCEPIFFKKIVEMCEYLVSRDWKIKLKFDHRRFEIYCALKFLKHLLEFNFFRTDDSVTRDALEKLSPNLENISLKITSGITANVFPDTEANTSGFLMNLPFLFDISGNELIEENRHFTVIPLDSVRIGADGLVECLLGNNWITDLGHTAEYWWAYRRLELPAAIDHGNDAVHTLLKHITAQNALALTHGVSFSFSLGFSKPPSLPALEELDIEINSVLNMGATERNVLSLLLWIYNKVYPNVPLLHKDLDSDQKFLENFPSGHDLLPTINKLKNILINKLLPGYYIPDKNNKELYILWQEEVNKSVQNTKAFFENKLSDCNTKINKDRIREKYWFHLFNYVKKNPIGEINWILDIGCGSGAHAIREFLPKGYHVHFYDSSERIIENLKVQLNKTKFSEDRYYFTRDDMENLPAIVRSTPKRLIHEILKTPYKIIFADAVLFHVSKEKLPEILATFHELLQRGGFLFANFKVNDHTLIGIDGRFFEFFESHDEIQRLLENAGFYINDVTITRQNSSMYGRPYPTQWAHFICQKRVKN